MSARGGLRQRGGAEAARQYVYGVILHKGRLSLGAIGIGDEPAMVQLVRYQDLAAVVSDTPLGALEPTRDNVLAHERVNQRVLQEHTLVPMSFGTVFRCREDVVELLRSAHATFRQALSSLAGKIELGLEVLWDAEQEELRLSRQNPVLRRARAAVAAGRHESFAARMEYGRLMEATLEQHAGEYASEILAALRELSVAAQVNEARAPRMILKAAFLVARGRRAAFTRRLRALAERHPNLTLRCTGPWPPYHFVRIRLEISGEEGVG